MSKLISKYDLKTRDYLFIFDDKLVLRHCQNQQYDVEIPFSTIIDITCCYSSGINKSYVHFNNGITDEKSRVDNTVFFPKSLNKTMEDIIVKYFSNITTLNATPKLTKEISSSTPKKKAKNWPIYFFIFAIIFFIWATSLPESVNKDEALNYDNRVMKLVAVIDENYLELVTGISEGTLAKLDLYNLCETIKSKQSNTVDTLLSIEFDSDIKKDYEKAVKDYAYFTSSIANSSMDYIDSGKVSDLSEVTTMLDDAGTIQANVIVARAEFLKQLDLTEEEFDSLVAEEIK